MSIDYCNGCDKRLDTDYIEYQEDGTLYCDACLDEMEAEQDKGIVLTDAEREAISYAEGTLAALSEDAPDTEEGGLTNRRTEVAAILQSLLARAGAEEGISDAK